MMSNELPKIDSTTLNSWGLTFAQRVIAYANARKVGKVMLQDLEGTPQVEAMKKAGCDMSGMKLVNRGEYDASNFLADTFIGDLPWSNDSSKVLEIAESVDGFENAYQYIEHLPDNK